MLAVCQQQELDNTLRRLDLSCTIEDQARDVSRDLKQEIAHLEKIVDDGATHNTEFDNT
jgi:hypothetical protein